ncbi:MAG: DNA-3-methyladenine glycosylase [Ignavibacteriota bacterium]
MRFGPILNRAFYERPSVDVARDLLGKNRRPRRDGRHDRGDRGPIRAATTWRRTRRAESRRGPALSSGPPGHAYVYFIYGMYQCLNLVCEPDGTAGCVLVRALEPVAGIPIMQGRRPSARKLEDLASGPGKLTLALAITLQHNGADVTRGSLTVREPSEKRRFEIAITPRIESASASTPPLRFLVAGNKSVSKSRSFT